MPNEQMAPDVSVRAESEEEVIAFRQAPHVSGDPYFFTVPSAVWARHEAARRTFDALNEELHFLWNESVRRVQAESVAQRDARQRQAVLADLAREGWTVQPPAASESTPEGDHA